MLPYPDIDPVAVSLGPIKIHWYGLCYVLGIGAAWILLNYRSRMEQFDWDEQQVSDLVFYATVGIILGGRLGSVLFYNLPYYLEHPLAILKVWEGGMAFHGGLLGVLTAIYIYTRTINKTFFQATDFIAPVVPVGLAAGRIGNFINGELWGRTTDVPWGMVFPGAGDIPRHPSQLYEFLLEGVVLFIVLWWVSRHHNHTMRISGLFMFLYGSFRFLVEFFREPDAHLGTIAFDWLTMGQILSTPMVIIGLILIFLSYRHEKKHA